MQKHLAALSVTLTRASSPRGGALKKLPIGKPHPSDNRGFPASLSATFSDGRRLTEFANSGKKAETVYSQRKVTWSLLPSEKVAAMRPDEASVCWLPRLALWERWIGAKRQDGEGNIAEIFNSPLRQAHRFACHLSPRARLEVTFCGKLLPSRPQACATPPPMVEVKVVDNRKGQTIFIFSMGTNLKPPPMAKPAQPVY